MVSWDGIIQSVKLLATAWTNRKFDSLKAQHLLWMPPRPSHLWGPPRLLSNGYQELYHRKKWVGRDHGYNWAPRHGGVLGEWRYNFTHSWPQHNMEMGGQLHVPAGLPQGKSPCYPLDRRLGGPQSRSGYGGEEKNSQPLPSLEPPDHPAHSPELYHWAIPSPKEL
jgi:hypothetical protein